MSIKSLNPNVNFNGTADQAIKLYERALGAKTENIMRYGDVPACNATDEQKQLVLHARLDIDGSILMISDTTPAHKVPEDSNVQIALHFNSEADLLKKWEALSEGGKITMPLADTFWGAKFGMLIDAYGLRWMFNFEHGKKQA